MLCAGSGVSAATTTNGSGLGSGAEAMLRAMFGGIGVSCMLLVELSLEFALKFKGFFVEWCQFSGSDPC